MITPIALDKASAAHYLSISVGTLEKLVREGRAPKPRLMSDKRVCWLRAELDDFAQSRPTSELLPPPNTGARKGRRFERADQQAQHDIR